MKISILGNGSWGRALFSVIKNTTPSVEIFGKGESVPKSDIVVLSVPTQAIREALKQISFKKNMILINTAKGIELSSHLLPHEIVAELVDTEIEYYSLIGPSFAKDVMHKMPTLVNLGYKNEYNSLSTVRHVLQTEYFRVRPTKGVTVLEMSGALKNIYAIGCGVAEGLKFGPNTRVKFIVLAIEEMYSLCRSLELSLEPDVTAGTIGDIILTCNSEESRNFRFGKLLAQKSVSNSLKEVNSTVEGYYSLASISYFEEKAGVELPLARFISNCIADDNPEKLQENFQQFVLGVS